MKFITNVIVGRFRTLISEFKLKLSKSLIKEIIMAFPGPKRTVDQGLLKAVYLEEFPDTKPPPVKPSKLRKEMEEEVKIEEPEQPEVKREYKEEVKVSLKYEESS